MAGALAPGEVHRNACVARSAGDFANAKSELDSSGVKGAFAKPQRQRGRRQRLRDRIAERSNSFGHECRSVVAQGGYVVRSLVAAPILEVEAAALPTHVLRDVVEELSGRLVGGLDVSVSGPVDGLASLRQSGPLKDASRRRPVAAVERDPSAKRRAVFRVG